MLGASTTIDCLSSEHHDDRVPSAADPLVVGGPAALRLWRGRGMCSDLYIFRRSTDDQRIGGGRNTIIVMF